MKKKQHVSWSEIQAWCLCRMKWHWAYEVKIAPKRVERAPSVGSCGHVAIAAMLRGKSWKKAVDEWLQEEISKRAPLFDEQRFEIQEVVDLILAIMPRYLSQYQDSFEPLLVEHKFDIPVRGIKTRLIGYWDALVRGEDGKLWLLEHKFPQARFRTDDNLDLDGQIGIYQYAAHRLGYPIVGTIYNQLLARLPAIPKLNKDGSVSRAVVYTDLQTYIDFVKKQKLDPSDYEEMGGKLVDFRFFQRNHIYRSPIETRLFARDMEHRIWDMQKKKKHIYRSESFIICGMCSYRELCLESLKGGDIDYIIENQFESKTSKKEVNSDQNEQFLDEGPSPQEEGDK